MTKHRMRSIFTILFMGIAVSGTGCGIFNPSTLFMSSEERDAYYHDTPSFREQMIAVEGSDILSELEDDSFLGKPYNNLSKFGDNILLIGEASYFSLLDDSDGEETTSYEFSFDVYSPWYNRITASLSHTEITCTSYRVVGEQLLLFDDETNTVTRYDETLSATGTYGVSSLGDIDEWNFYPSGDADVFLGENTSDGILVKITFDGSMIQTEPIDLPYYDIQVMYASPDTQELTVFGIDEDSFREEIARIDTDTLTVSEEYSAEDASDIVLDSGYTFFPSGNVLLRRADFTDDSALSALNFSYYDASGNGISEFSYDCSSYSTPSNAQYLSQDFAFFEDEAVAFFLVYNVDCQPYLLVWDYSDPTPDMTALEVPIMRSISEETSDEDDGSSDDWGELSEVRLQADSLAQENEVTIGFASQVPETIGIYQVEGCSDLSTLSDALDTLAKTLDCYPAGFFSQLCFGDNTGITIYLVSAIWGADESMLESPTGFMDSGDHELVMVLSTEYLWDWDYTISHEISHMIDRRLEYRAAYVEESLFSEDSWAALNPDDFSYLDTYENYKDNEQYSLYSNYFADEYGTTFPTEDRAELFGLAMSDYLGSFDEDVFFQANAPTTEKLRYYSACIRDGFDTTGWAIVMPWEKILGD